jgi:hypothetical protein
MRCISGFMNKYTKRLFRERLVFACRLDALFADIVKKMNIIATGRFNFFGKKPDLAKLINRIFLH